VAEQVYLTAECDKVSRELGYPAHGRTYSTHMIMGQVFDPEKPETYVESFAIRSKSNHTTWVHLRVQSVANPPCSPLTKAGARSVGGCVTTDHVYESSVV
jgi:hypothetical protein